MSEHVCSVCGKVCANEHGLKVHTARAHKPTSPEAASRPKAPAGKRAKKPAAPDARDLPAMLEEAFASSAETMELHARVSEACLAGLEKLLASNKRLRLAYMKASDQLRKLDVEIAAMEAGEAA